MLNFIRSDELLKHEGIVTQKKTSNFFNKMTPWLYVVYHDDKVGWQEFKNAQ